MLKLEVVRRPDGRTEAAAVWHGEVVYRAPAHSEPMTCEVRISRIRREDGPTVTVECLSYDALGRPSWGGATERMEVLAVEAALRSLMDDFLEKENQKSADHLRTCTRKP